MTNIFGTMMVGIRHGFIRVGRDLPTEAEQRTALRDRGVDPDRITVEKPIIRKVAGSYAVNALSNMILETIRCCRSGDQIIIHSPMILAATTDGIRQILMLVQKNDAHVVPCDPFKPVMTFADVEEFVVRAKKGWAAARAEHARKFSGKSPGRRVKRMKVSDKRASEWWHDKSLTKEWIEDQTGVSRRTLSTRFGHRSKERAENE